MLAERQFIIESALNVPVHTALEDTIGQGSTFGAVIRARLQDLGATGERWASWKEIDAGWVVKLEFIAADIAHDARWQYEPKKAALAPTNSEAKTLSQQGELPGGLIPRLRAVGGEERAQDASRFDSGAFDVSWRGSESRGSDSRRDTAPQPESKPFSRRTGVLAGGSVGRHQARPGGGASLERDRRPAGGAPAPQRRTRGGHLVGDRAHQ